MWSNRYLLFFPFKDLPGAGAEALLLGHKGKVWHHLTCYLFATQSKIKKPFYLTLSLPFSLVTHYFCPRDKALKQPDQRIRSPFNLPFLEHLEVTL